MNSLMKNHFINIFAIFSIVFATISLHVAVRKDFSFRNSETKPAVSTSTVSFGTAPSSQTILSPDVGVMDSFAFDPLSVQNSYPTRLSTLQSAKRILDQQLWHLQDLEKVIRRSISGEIGIIQATVLILLIFIVISTVLSILCLAIIVRKFFRLIRYPILRLIYPKTSDPSKNFLAGHAMMNHGILSELEQDCKRSLFGRDNL